jgi:hypothetical protein
MTNNELDTMNYIKDNLNSLEPTIPIVIPSYKNRRDCIVKTLDKVSKNDIYVFVYEKDYTESGYDVFDNKPNVHFIKIKGDWRSIQKKRCFIQNYMLGLENVHDYIMMDDDVVEGRVVTVDGISHNHTPLINYLGALEYAHKSLGEKRTYSCCASSNIELGHWKDNKRFKKDNGQLFCVYAISNDFVRSSKIMFRDVEDINEDCVLTFDLFKAGYSGVNFPWLRFLLIHEGAKGYSIASSPEKHYKNVINTLSIFRENSKLINQEKLDTWGCKPSYNKINPYWFQLQPILDNPNLTIQEKYDTIKKKILSTEKEEKPQELNGFFE